MMPARRAVCRGSPFLTRPDRTRRRASRDIAIEPAAMASRAVTGFSPTSTIFTRPRRSTCDSVATAVRRARLASPAFPTRPAAPALPALPAPPALCLIVFSLRQEERQALERDGQVHALQLDVGRRLQRPG